MSIMGRILGYTMIITLALIINISIKLLTNDKNDMNSILNRKYEIMEQLKTMISRITTIPIVTTETKINTNHNPNSNEKNKKVVELEDNNNDEYIIKLLKIELDYDNEDNSIYNNIEFVIHHNGNVKPCGNTKYIDTNEPTFLNSITKSMEYMEKQPTIKTITTGLKKYYFDSMLTSTLAHAMLSNGMCSPDDESYIEEGNNNLLSYCDMGKDRTPLLPDHNHHIRVFKDSQTYSLPCHFHTREGLRITSFKELTDIAKNSIHGDDDNDDNEMECVDDDNSHEKKVCSTKTKNDIVELHLYAVPAGRVFMFAPSYIGEIFNLPHVSTYDDTKQISLEVLSVEPRVFDVKHFFSKDEAEDIVSRVLQETTETHRMKRSSTGATGYTLNSRRTSENGFDTSSSTALTLKERCFYSLGIDRYDESFADGLQVLRYNVSTAYVAHQDFLDDPSGRDEHDYDSAHVGTNRFATILLYMSDLPNDDDGDGDSGGHVVFTKATLPDSQGISEKEALNKIRTSHKLSSLFKHKTWQEHLLVQCKSNKLAIKPYLSRAVLFYSQHPNGQEDLSAEHGACPVVSGVKWAANLWVWNGPRNGYPNAPANHKAIERNAKDKSKGYNTNTNNEPKQLHAGFRNSGTNPKYENAQLYYEDTFWANLGFGDKPLGVNTFKGHRWNVRVDGEVVIKWVIHDREDKQLYEI